MNEKSVWLIDHKASLSGDSPMNMDGSTWLTGIGVLAAENKAAAMEAFKEYLSGKGMELLELYDHSEYRPDKFSDTSSKSAQVNNAVRLVLQDGMPCYVYARTSEYYDALSEGGGDA